DQPSPRTLPAALPIFSDAWPIARAVPPELLWRHTLSLARERASRGLRDALGEPRGTSWTELAFGEATGGAHPWTTPMPVPVGTRSEEHTSELQSRENL